MPKTVQDTYQVFRFEELPKDVQEKVIEQLGQEEYEMYHPARMADIFDPILEERGLPTHDVEWSLSYSQGDGVAFYGTIDLGNVPIDLKSLGFDVEGLEVNAWISRNSWATHYSHYNTMDVEVEYVGEDEVRMGLEESVDKLQEELERLVRDTSRELEALGYAELERITSKEYILDLLDYNDVWFREDGSVHEWN